MVDKIRFLFQRLLGKMTVTASVNIWMLCDVHVMIKCGDYYVSIAVTRAFCFRFWLFLFPRSDPNMTGTVFWFWVLVADIKICMKMLMQQSNILIIEYLIVSSIRYLKILKNELTGDTFQSPVHFLLLTIWELSELECFNILNVLVCPDGSIKNNVSSLRTSALWFTTKSSRLQGRRMACRCGG